MADLGELVDEFVPLVENHWSYSSLILARVVDDGGFLRSRHFVFLLLLRYRRVAIYCTVVHGEHELEALDVVCTKSRQGGQDGGSYRLVQQHRLFSCW